MKEISIEELTNKKIYDLLNDIEHNRNSYLNEEYHQEYLHQIKGLHKEDKGPVFPPEKIFQG